MATRKIGLQTMAEIRYWIPTLALIQYLTTSEDVAEITENPAFPEWGGTMAHEKSWGRNGSCFCGVAIAPGDIVLKFAVHRPPSLAT
jgi:hypothetical protein